MQKCKSVLAFYLKLPIAAILFKAFHRAIAVLFMKSALHFRADRGNHLFSAVFYTHKADDGKRSYRKAQNSR